MSSPAPTPATPKGHPIGFWFIFSGELAERCSYYGMNAILTLYMVKSLDFAETKASAWVSYFIAACYFTPLLGGWIADRYLGKYRTIVMFSIPYVLGNALMLIHSQYALVGALAILALGSGVIKPNISTLMGMTYDQQRPGQDQLRSDAFAWFYFAINIGSAISQTSMPLLRDRFGPNLAFLLPTILMSVALLIFALGKPFYAVEKIERKRKTPEEKAEQWRAIGRLMGVFVLTAVFWSIFKHYPTVWVYFTGERLDTTIFGYTYQPDQFQPLNAYFVLTLLPTSMLVYRWLARRGIKLRPTDKMQIGFFFTFLTPVLFVLCYLATANGKGSIAWVVGFFFTITLAEVLISPVGLELAFVAAPKTMKSVITACFLLTNTAGNLVNAWVTPLYSLKLEDGQRFCTPGQYFGVQAAVAAAALVAFFFVAKPFNRALAKQEQEAAAAAEAAAAEAAKEEEPCAE